MKVLVLAKAILEVAGNKKLGIKTRKKAEGFSWDKVVEQYISVYEEAYQSRKKERSTLAEVFFSFVNKFNPF